MCITGALTPAYRQTVRRILPITTQVAIRAGCSDVRDNWGNIVSFAGIAVDT